jgi:hypothetical protein
MTVRPAEIENAMTLAQDLADEASAMLGTALATLGAALSDPAACNGYLDDAMILVANAETRLERALAELRGQGGVRWNLKQLKIKAAKGQRQ